MQSASREKPRTVTKRARSRDSAETSEGMSNASGHLRERTKLRTNYRGLINEVGESREEMVQPGSEALRAAIGKADELFLQVSNPREAALDSEFLAMCSQYAAEQANRLSTQMKTYDVPTYIHRLSLFLRGKLVVNNAGLAEGIDEGIDEATLRRAGKRRRTEDNGDEEGEEEQAEDIDDETQTLRWPELGALVAGFAQSTPSLDCLTGAMVAPPPKEKKVRAQRAKKDKPSEKVEPEAITDTKALEMEGQTSKRVAIAKKKLEQAKVKNFFEYIVDPESYSQTVENLFHLSFLVRNGMAAVELDEGGQPALEPRNPPDDDDYTGGLEKKQCVVRLDYDMYQNLIKAYDIQQSFLPHRTKSYSQSATQSSQRDVDELRSSKSGQRKRRRRSDADEDGEEEEEERRPAVKRAPAASSSRGKGKQKRVASEEDEDE